MNKSLVLSAICIASSACSPALMIEQRTLVQGDGEVYCRKVTPTGSHRMQKVCTTRAERADDDKNAQATLERERQRQHDQALYERSNPRAGL